MAPGGALLELGLVIVALAVLARTATRFAFSPIPLYLVAGLAVGRGGIVPVVTAERFIEVGAEIGVILLLLMLGLEYSGSELTGAMRRNASVGLADLALNLTPGLAAGLLLGWSPIAALLLGGVTYISSSGIVAKLLADLGWVANRETSSVLSLLVFEDLVMVLYLPLVAGLLLGGGPGAMATSIAIAVGLTVATLVVSLRFGPALSRFVFSRSDEALLFTIFGITLVVAGMAERLQSSAAVGAFLVGLGISGPAADSARNLLRPVRDLFAGVFFFFFGLEIDPGAIPPVLGVATALAVVTTATKELTARLAARRAGFGPRARRRAGALLMARGEFSIVIAGLGVAAAAEPELGPLAAAYVLLLAVAGPLLAKLADVRIESERERRQREAEERRRRWGGPLGI